MDDYIYNGEYDYMDVEDFVIFFSYDDYADCDMENDFIELGLLPYVDISDRRYRRIVEMPHNEDIMTILTAPHG